MYLVDRRVTIQTIYSLGTAACEYYVMPGETAANAMYSRKLVKAKQGRRGSCSDHQEDERYDPADHDKSRPAYCAKVGMVDEIVDMTDIRPYIQAFTEAA